MAGLQIQGAGGSVVEAGAFSAKALHTTNKPHDYGALGHYRAVLTTGTIGAGMAALGELVQMRWIDATRFCLIQRISVLEFRNVATAWTAGRFLFDVVRSTAWSVDGTGGGVPAVVDPQMQVRATTMGASLFSSGFRLATTAALGAGTKTLDTLSMGACFGNVDAVAVKYHIPQSNVVTTGGPASGPGIDLVYPDVGAGEHPIVLASNGGSTSEGISIRATVPASGTWSASFFVQWCEVTAF